MAAAFLMARRVFRPKIWAIAATVLLSALMIWLGVWQIHRGQAKQALLERFAAAASAAPVALDPDRPAEPEILMHAQARGTFDAAHQMLLDNQSREGVPGYHVWTPLRLAQGGTVIVDRGWVAASGDRAKLPSIPAPGGPVRVAGLWRTLPVPGLRLQVDNCGGDHWPRVVTYPTIGDLRCLAGGDVADGLLLMDADLPAGYARDWSAAPELTPSRHYGYAAQWFMFTLVLLFFFFRLSFRPTR